MKIIDTALEKSVLKLIPNTVTPNQVTIFRFVTVPFVIWLLLTHQYGVGGVLFAFSAFTDAIDGAMARTRDMITDWGKLYDPLADKLLIGSAALILVWQHIGVWVAVLMVVLDILLMANGAYKRYVTHEEMQAEWSGKLKMVLQAIGLIILIMYLVFGISIFLLVATYILYAAIFFASISLFVYRAI